MPLLLEALAQLAKEKPEEPIEFIAKYLLDHNPEKNWVRNNNSTWWSYSKSMVDH